MEESVDDLSKKYSDACCKFDINVGKILKKLFPKNGHFMQKE